MLLRGAQRLFVADAAARVPPLGECVPHLRRWAAGGKFEQMHDRLRELWRNREERAPEPTAAVGCAIDSQFSSGRSERLRCRQDKGRKRNLVVDSLGLLLMVNVVRPTCRTAGADQVFREAVDKYPSLEKLYVDSGYAGTCAVHLKQEHQLDVEVVRHPAIATWDAGSIPTRASCPVLADSKGFVVLPKRWVAAHPRMVRTLPPPDYAS